MHLCHKVAVRSEYCLDIDECGTNMNDCNPENGTCTNTEGSFNCTCNVGYGGDGINCTSEC